jgi:hypothetical protein
MNHIDIFIRNPDGLYYFDSEDVPLRVGDLIRVRHFTARSRRKVFMYKKVLKIKDGVYAVSFGDLGVKSIEDCHKCRIEDCYPFTILDGDCYEGIGGVLISWWERKKELKEYNAKESYRYLV